MSELITNVKKMNKEFKGREIEEIIVEEIYNMEIIPLTKGMLFKDETNEEYVYTAGLPGLTKNDIEIKLFIEEKLLTILVVTKKDSIFVEEGYSFRIAKLKEEVKYTDEKSIKVDMSNGILEIRIPKAIPIEEYIL